MTADTLGTPRIITNVSGAVISRHDYQPFGEELLAGMKKSLVCSLFKANLPPPVVDPSKIFE